MRNQFNHLLVFVFIMLNVSNIHVYSQQPSLSKVQNEFNEPLGFAWVGGLDAAQFNEIDLNLDGIMDIMVFDRRGDRKLCFVNQGIPGEINYQYAPELASLFPPLSEWAKFVDYDADGRMDIFTYSPGYASMVVYRNISTTSLKFERMVYPYLTSLQGGGYVNIFVTNADYPGIADVDGDGDLDILSFWGLGSFLEMHQNMSMEKYGVPDSLDFMQTTFCWGQFAESDESNQLYLDTCLGSVYSSAVSNTKVERHTGSTLLYADLNGNGLQDLMLGDVDFPGLFALYNGGSLELAYITSVDTLFPNLNEPINLFAMPAASLIDVDNDGLSDLLVGVFDPGLNTSQNKYCSWLYLNVGTADHPSFELETKAFLQEQMIDLGSGAYPVLFDFDKDGLKDLFIGNYGYYSYSYYDNYFLKSVYYSKISFYKNVGTFESPIFQMWDSNFGNLSSINLVGLIPAFADLDGDGDTDMLVGKADGKLLELINDGEGSFTLSEDYFSGIDVGEFSAPQLFDLDKDGYLDLIIGERAGNLNYFRNIGNQEDAQFEFVTDSLGKVNVTDLSLSYDGYSVPCFFIDQVGKTGLLVGSEQGNVFYFNHIDNNLDDKFEPSDQLAAIVDTANVNFDRGMRTGVAISDLKGQGTLQLIIGNYSGGLEIFNGSAQVTTSVTSIPYQTTLSLVPNPAKNSVLLSGITNNFNPVSLVAISMDGHTTKLTEFYYKKEGLVVNIGYLKQGIYLLVFSQSGEDYRGKLVVMP